jgi:Leucine-rich repeat (LRR) protein
MDFDLNVVDTRGSTSTGFPAPGQTESSRKRKYIVPGIRQYESPFFRYLKSMVTGMRTLTRLVLKNLRSLQSLPIDFSELQNIRHLDLSGCYNLSKLPSTFSELMQLQYLALQDCMNLSIPLDIFGEISTLEYVNFKGCEKMVGLPEGIPYQKHLRYLNLLHTSLLQLPGKLEILDHLEQLIIGTHQLKELSLSMANLRGLKELFLIDCSGLKRILPKELQQRISKFWL